MRRHNTVLCCVQGKAAVDLVGSQIGKSGAAWLTQVCEATGGGAGQEANIGGMWHFHREPLLPHCCGLHHLPCRGLPAAPIHQRSPNFPLPPPLWHYSCVRLPLPRRRCCWCWGPSPRRCPSSAPALWA